MRDCTSEGEPMGVKGKEAEKRVSSPLMGGLMESREPPESGDTPSGGGEGGGVSFSVCGHATDVVNMSVEQPERRDTHEKKILLYMRAVSEQVNAVMTHTRTSDPPVGPKNLDTPWCETDSVPKASIISALRAGSTSGPASSSSGSILDVTSSSRRSG